MQDENEDGGKDRFHDTLLAKKEPLLGGGAGKDNAYSNELNDRMNESQQTCAIICMHGGIYSTA